MQLLRPCRTAVFGAAAVALTASLLAQEGRSFKDLLVANDVNTWHYYNRGDGTFNPPIEYFINRTADAEAADFDRDGIQDIVLGFGIRLGNGDGRFRLRLLLSHDKLRQCFLTSNCAYKIKVVDLDDDGWLDVVFSCFEEVFLLFGTGDDRFAEHVGTLRTPPIEERCEGGDDALQVGDLDGDGFPDLKVGEPLWGTVVYMNNGDRTFRQLEELPGDSEENRHPLHPEWYFTREWWGDFDDDDHLDIIAFDPLLLVNDAQAYLYVFHGEGDLRFSRSRYHFGALREDGRREDFFKLYDVNGDANLDVVVLRVGAKPGVPCTIAFLIGDAAGGIDEVVQHELAAWITVGDEPPDVSPLLRVVVTDFVLDEFTGDGIVDLVLLNRRGGTGAIGALRAVGEGVLLVYPGLGGGQFAEHPRIFPGPLGATLLVNLGDIDRQFIRGDADDNGEVNLSDAVVILQALFLGAPVSCGQTLDVDDDNEINLSDAIYLLAYLFRGGGPPGIPFPEPGIDQNDPIGEARDIYRWPGCSPTSWERYARGARWGG
jgi:hypothetical protein